MTFLSKTCLFIICVFFIICPFGQIYGQDRVPVDTIGRGAPDYQKNDPAKYHRHFSSRPRQVSATSNVLRSVNTNTVHVTGSFVVTISTTASNCGDENGSVILHASGGTAPYTYSFEGQPFQSSAYYITAGDYTFSAVVKDATNATVSVSINIPNNKPSVTVIPVTGTLPSGCATSDGSYNLQASGGLAPYSYSVDMVNWQTSNTFSNLPPGNYTFFVKDANGCIGQIWWPIGPRNCNAINGYSGGGSNLSLCGAPGIVSITPNNAPPPLQYSIDGGSTYQSDPSFTVPAGQYDIQIKDANGALYLYRSFVYPICPLTANTSVQDATCGNNDGTITLNASNGTAPYQYSIDGINFQSSGSFTGLAAGNYSVVIQDANGAARVLSSLIVNSGCPLVTATEIDAHCGDNAGSITASVTGGTPPYTYSLDNISFQASNIFSPLPPASYNIFVLDANGIQGSTYVTVGNSCLQLTATPANVVCGNHNGSITITGSGGTSPYTYSIDGTNYQSSNAFTGLSAGNYTVYIKDAASTISSTPVVITDSPGPTSMSVIALAADCNNNGGSLTVSVTGGTSPYQFSTDDINFQANNVFQLPPDQYTVYIKDANACLLFQGPWRVPLLCLQVSATETDASCNSTDGTITASASNGTEPYQYSINGINFQSSPLFTGVAPGAYTVTAKDAGGLTNTAPITVAKVCLNLTLTISDATCGNANGKIVAAGSNGTAPYQYSIDGTNWQTDYSFVVTQGNYTVTLKDANGFTTTTGAVVGNVAGPQLSANSTAASCANNDGGIVLSALGGTAPMQYAADGLAFQNNTTITGLASGSHTAIVQDANGCTASQPVVIPFTNTLTVNAGADPIICEGKATTLAAQSNGTNFSWTPATGLNNTAILRPQASPSVTTAYTVTAIWGICQATASVTVHVNPAPVADAGKNVSVCYGLSAQLHGSGGSIFLWSPATYLDNPAIADPAVSKPRESTAYSLSVTDGLGCQSLQNSNVTVTVTRPPGIFVGNDTSILADQPVPLNVDDIDNSGFTIFGWSPSDGLSDPAIQNPVAIVNQSTTYTVVATTPSGCEATGTISIKVYGVSDIFVPNAFTPNGDGHNDVLRVLPVGIKQLTYFAIFNRWGQRVFFTTNPAIGWDGTQNGQQQKSDTYIWMAGGVNYKGDVVERKGTAILIR